MLQRRRSALRPAFVAIVAGGASALAACADLDPFGDNPRPLPAFEDAGSSSSSFNPPPRQPDPLPSPDFGRTVTQAVAPPALGGATVLASESGHTAIVSDPDRDRILLVDLTTKTSRAVALTPGDEPGRMAEDADGRVHVVLARAGTVATIDEATGAVLARRPVCGAPQGIARLADALFVACAGGELVRLPASPASEATTLARIDADLRDVVAIGDRLLVSRLRKAEVLEVRASDGAVLGRASRAAGDLHGRDPFVGWRLTPTPNGAALVHQMARVGVVQVEQPRAYVGVEPCGGPVSTAITPFATASGVTAETGPFVDNAVVPIDLARTRDGTAWVIIAAGNHHIRELPQVQILTQTPTTGGLDLPCAQATMAPALEGEAVAAAFTRDDRSLLVFSREPAALHVLTKREGTFWEGAFETIALGGDSREDTGHAVFHSNSGGRIACVSCHPGGADDGRIWTFDSGPRRTQTLQGTLEGTAPYHWGGDVPGLDVFASDVFVTRMGGRRLESPQVDALRSWLVRIPASKTGAGSEAATRGKTLFESSTVGCSSCHAGDRFTNSESVDVGTGGVFQVPSLLGLGVRAPYLHDGRATTLHDRFNAVGGGDRHGLTSQLTSTQIDDLVWYLETL